MSDEPEIDQKLTVRAMRLAENETVPLEVVSRRVLVRALPGRELVDTNVFAKGRSKPPRLRSVGSVVSQP